MAQLVTDLIYSVTSCLNCFPGSPTLKINGRSFKILRLLGEGGFSYVYLVQDTSTAELFALKKIRCPFGAESVTQAMREVGAYRLFAHVPGIIHMVDHCVAKERGGGDVSGIGAGGEDARTVYVLLPYYRRGNLQDMINANLVNHTRFPERRLLILFLGLCRALKGMHQCKGPVLGMERMEVGDPEDGVRRGGGEGDGAGAGRQSRGRNKGKAPARGRSRADEDEDHRRGSEEEDERPLMHGESRMGPGGATKSYAHRDIKPGNIMIDDTGSSPILMDLGSVAVCPLPITSHSLAIATQDIAAEHSTMPYRAPELFDVRTGTVIDVAVDIWSIGCTLFACLVGKSPFEMRSDETGGSLNLCVLGGDWRFPDEGSAGHTAASIRRSNTAKGKEPDRGAGAGQDSAAGNASGSGSDAPISEPIREIVRRCLRVEPAERPDIDELMGMIENAVAELPEDDEP